jgi:ubiquinone/menaquinone biosynthesis C-methylase UbiE
MTAPASPTETELKASEIRYFDTYYHQADMQRQLMDGYLVQYFENEFGRTERLYQQPLNRPATVLDLGSGWGTLAIWAAARCPQWRVIASDYVPYSLTLHDAMAARMQLPRRNWRAAADWDSLPFADNTFDYIIADRALHHALDPVRTLREVRRVTRQGGLLIALREPALPLYRPGARATFAVNMLAEGTNDHIYTPPQWADILRQSGWQPRLRVHTEDMERFLSGGTTPLGRRGRKWLRHRVPLDWLERLMYAFVARWGSTPELSKITLYAQAL